MYLHLFFSLIWSRKSLFLAFYERWRFSSGACTPSCSSQYRVHVKVEYPAAGHTARSCSPHPLLISAFLFSCIRWGHGCSLSSSLLPLLAPLSHFTQTLSLPCPLRSTRLAFFEPTQVVFLRRATLNVEHKPKLLLFCKRRSFAEEGLTWDYVSFYRYKVTTPHGVGFRGKWIFNWA